MEQDEKYIKKESWLKSKAKSTFTKIAVIVVVLLIIVSAVSLKNYTNAREKIRELEAENKRLNDPVVQYEVASNEVDLALIKSEIQDIGELATVEYLYTDAGKFEDPAKLFGKEIPFSFTTKSFIAKWDGIIKAGVKVEEITVEVSAANKEIIVCVPEAEILSHEIDNESIETLDEKNGLFNPIKVEDVREFDGISKDAMEQRAVENGLLEKAQENAESIIYKLINTDAVRELEYTITFKKDTVANPNEEKVAENKTQDSTAE